MGGISLPVFVFGCVSCGKTVAGTEKACPRCGASFENVKFECPFCGELVSPTQNRCEACGTEFQALAAEVLESAAVELDGANDRRETPQDSSSTGGVDDVTYECPNCGKPVSEQDAECPHCGVRFA